MNKTLFSKSGIAFLVCMISWAAGLYFGHPSQAGAAVKCYTIGTSNVQVYSNTGLSKRYGAVYPSDEMTVSQVTDRYCKVTYPVARGRKTGYINRNKILTKTTGSSYRSRAKITTYRRANNKNAYGYIAKGDTVKVLGASGSYTQVKYPVGGGYKYAFIKTSDLKNYILSSTPAPSFTAPNDQAMAAPVPVGCKFSKKTGDNGWYGYHDINRGVAQGTPVYAIADGTVTFKQAYRVYHGVQKLTSYGNFIDFQSADKSYRAKYCHLNSFAGVRQRISSASTVRAGGSQGIHNLGSRTVRKGEIIGYIGTTGNSTGTHLHFELYRNGMRIDPTSVFRGLY